MSNVSDYIDINKEQFKGELFDFLRIPSISTDSGYKNDVKDAANYILGKLDELDLDRTELFKTDGNPIVYGELITDESKPTVLVYGHYDVQPPDPM